jgi:hypothetical protein
MRRALLAGLAAGAAGTSVLNAVTYLDMLVRARPASGTPERTVRRIEELSGLRLAAEGPDSEPATNRRGALGALLGIAVGLGTGVAYAVARETLGRAPAPVLALGAGLAANIGSVGPMAALGVTDPREWSAVDWASDVIPHLAYGVATAVACELTRA